MSKKGNDNSPKVVGLLTFTFRLLHSRQPNFDFLWARLGVELDDMVLDWFSSTGQPGEQHVYHPWIMYMKTPDNRESGFGPTSPRF